MTTEQLVEQSSAFACTPNSMTTLAKEQLKLTVAPPPSVRGARHDP